MTTGELIRQARKQAGLTQKELGERAGIAEPTIRKYESGRLNPKPVTLKKIGAALNVSWYELLSDNVEEQASAIINHMKKTLSSLDFSPNSSLSPLVQAAAFRSSPHHKEDKELEDLAKVAFLFSLLNDAGKSEAMHCFYEHLNKESIPEVIEYLNQLAGTDQYKR